MRIISQLKRLKMKHSKYGWLIPGLGLCCFVKLENGDELYGVFTPGGQFIRHLTKEEAYERHFGDLPKMQKFNKNNSVSTTYAHKIPIPA
jgi:hypothetical protein